MKWKLCQIGGFDRVKASLAFATLLRPAVLLTTALLFSPAASAALEFPALTGRVVDNANLLDPEQERRLSQQLEQHETETSNQVVVVTLPSLQGTTIENYSTRLGRHWRLGQENRDNGVLLVVAPKSRKVRIEVGYGLEGDLPDATAKLIIEKEILPAFRSRDYPGGITAGVDAILSAIAGSYEPQAKSPQKTDKFGLLIVFAFVLMVVLKLFLGDRLPIDLYIGGIRVGGWGRSSGSGSRSGGGFSGGGGSFGGGGSSGSW